MNNSIQQKNALKNLLVLLIHQQLMRFFKISPASTPLNKTLEIVCKTRFHLSLNSKRTSLRLTLLDNNIKCSPISIFCFTNVLLARPLCNIWMNLLTIYKMRIGENTRLLIPINYLLIKLSSNIIRVNKISLIYSKNKAFK